MTGVDGRVLAGLGGRVLAGVDDHAVTAREAGADGFDGGKMLVLLVGVVGLELTEELLAVSTDDLLLVNIREDWIEGRE